MRSTYIVLVLLSILAILHLGFDPLALVSGLSNIGILVGEAFPADLSILEVAFYAIVETVEIAFLGTFFGTLFALPLALLASRNLFSSYITIPARLVLSGLRTIPALLWALLFVIIVGFGPFAGVLALMFYSAGYLGKLQYEAIEGIKKSALEAIKGMGTTKLQQIRYVVLPEAANHLVSHVLFMFEYNIRASTILGFVGAGGIGFYIMGYMKLLQYDKVVTLLFMVFIAVVSIDYLSSKIREKYH